MFDEDWDSFITDFIKNDGESYVLSMNKRFNRSSAYLSTELFNERLSDYSDSIVIFFNLPGITNVVAHGHDHFELTYIYKGSCRQIINGHRMDMKAGDICLLGPADVHSLQIGDEETIYFAILIQKSLFQDSLMYLLDEKNLLRNYFTGSFFNATATQSILYFPTLEDSPVTLLIHILIREAFEKKPYYSKYIESTLSLLLIALERSYRQMLEECIQCDPKLIDMLIFIQKNRRTVTLTETAAYFNYHPNYLSSLLKKGTGKTFSEILSDAKMSEAVYLLEHSDLSIDKMIEKIGFYDNSHFHRAFKKRYDMTPAAYRELKKQ